MTATRKVDDMTTKGRVLALLCASVSAALILPACSEAANPRSSGTSRRADTFGGSRIEEFDPSIAYSGVWSSNMNPGHSGGSAMLSTDPGATATVPFTGTGIHWIGYQDQWSGIASIFLDGSFLQTVDTYAAAGQFQAVLYSIEGLPLGPHQLTIMVLGVHGAASSEAWIWVDAFDVVNAAAGTDGGDPWAASTRYEETDPTTTLTGTWYAVNSTAFSGGSAILSEERGARATFSFAGSRVRWIGYRDEWCGIADIYLDGSLVAVYDTYASPAQAQAVVFQTGNIGSGPHTLAVEAEHAHVLSAREKWVWVDAFDVVP
jgi:hypothetical protein